MKRSLARGLSRFCFSGLQLASLLGLLGLAACGGGGGGSAGTDSASTSSTPAAVSAMAVPVGVTGWASQGSGTTGGAAAPASNIYVVHNRAELNAALANTNSPTYATSASSAASEAKVIYVVGTIWGTDLGNGQFANEAYYKSLNATAANWDFDLYVKSVDPSYTPTSAETTAISKLSSARTTLQNLQKAQIQFIIPSNTTIIGVGTDAKLIDGYFSINATSNIIIRNMEFQSPQDLAPAYTNTVGSEEWNAKYKAIGIVTGKQIWIDHCTLSDGAHFDSSEIRTINGVTLEVMRHDGLIDIEDSSDYITVSYSIFKNHDKTNMVGGSGDQNGTKERAYNHLTFSNNIWQDSVQRAPRARFGQIHVYNNYYTGNTDQTSYAMGYYIGMGAESKILSEGNAFYLTGSKASVSRVISNLNGYQFKDVGSWYNGVPASSDLEAAAQAALTARYSSAQTAATNSGFTVAPYTNVLGWTPPYSYTLAASAEDLKQHNLANAGAGKLPVTAASGTRPMLDDTTAANYTVAAALAGSDAWTPQTVNAGQANAGRLYAAGFTPDVVVASDGTGAYTSIQAAINALSTSTAARVYIQVKAGNYNEQLVIPASTTTAFTIYSTESGVGKVRIYNALAQSSPQTSYSALVGATAGSSVYAGNTDALVVYNACMASSKVSAIGKECAATIRVRNSGFQLVNITVENAWGDTDASNNQAPAVMLDKADKVVMDGVRLVSNQDTLYLANSGKRSYFVASEILGDVDFIFGPGIGVFDGSTIRTLGARKPSGTSVTAPSTTAATQIYGLVFNNCVFLSDGSATDDSTYLARQWDDSTDAPGKTFVRNSVLGRHIALTTGPWSPTTIGGVATTYANGSQPYLAEYRNWDEVQRSSGSSSSAAASSAASSSVASSAASSAASSSSSVTVITGTTDVLIPGATPLTNAFTTGGLASTAGASYALSSASSSAASSAAASSSGPVYAYTLVGAGSISVASTTSSSSSSSVASVTTYSDSMEFVYLPVSQDFTLVARLTSQEVPTGLSTANVRAGLMVRSSLDPGAPYYAALMRGIPRLQWEQRKNAGENISSSNLGYTISLTTQPLWIKLQRTGTSITLAYSTNGTTWSGTKTQDFSATGYTPFGTTVYVGLVGVSGSATVTSTSTFDNVSITYP